MDWINTKIDFMVSGMVILFVVIFPFISISYKKVILEISYFEFMTVEQKIEDKVAFSSILFVPVYLRVSHSMNNQWQRTSLMNYTEIQNEAESWRKEQKEIRFFTDSSQISIFISSSRLLQCLSSLRALVTFIEKPCYCDLKCRFWRAISEVAIVRWLIINTFGVFALQFPHLWAFQFSNWRKNLFRFNIIYSQ